MHTYPHPSPRENNIVVDHYVSKGCLSLLIQQVKLCERNYSDCGYSSDTYVIYGGWFIWNSKPRDNKRFLGSWKLLSLWKGNKIIVLKLSLRGHYTDVNTEETGNLGMLPLNLLLLKFLHLTIWSVRNKHNHWTKQ